MGVPGDSMVENPPANSGDVSVIPGLGRSPGEGNGNPPQHCLEIPWTEEPGGWLLATVHGVTKSWI